MNETLALLPETVGMTLQGTDNLRTIEELGLSPDLQDRNGTVANKTAGMKVLSCSEECFD